MGKWPTFGLGHGGEGSTTSGTIGDNGNHDGRDRLVAVVGR